MRSAVIAFALLAVVGAAPALAQKAKYDPWPDLVTNVFDDRPIADGAGVLSLEAPYRAEDAAIVPMTIRSELPADSPLRMKKLTLVIDNNPSPVAAEFSFGDAGRVNAIETRVRVDAYTNVHAVAELSDGKLYMVEKFVKASGGCSAPSMKVAGAADKIGEMKFRRFDADSSKGAAEAQVMIRHPNNSGLQMDLINNYYIPAYFVQDLKLTVGEDLLLRMEGGISISENPTFRVSYSGFADAPVTVEAKDTKAAVYRQVFPAEGGGAS
jgi:sulfur-oxidizing protein SoxY